MWKWMIGLAVIITLGVMSVYSKQNDIDYQYTFEKVPEDCVSTITVIFTKPQEVHNLCLGLGARHRDDGTLIQPGDIILGCTDGRVMVLDKDLKPDTIAHEMNHVLEKNCSENYRPVVIEPPDEEED